MIQRASARPIRTMTESVLFSEPDGDGQKMRACLPDLLRSAAEWLDEHRDVVVAAMDVDYDHEGGYVHLELYAQSDGVIRGGPR